MSRGVSTGAGENVGAKRIRIAGFDPSSSTTSTTAESMKPPFRFNISNPTRHFTGHRETIESVRDFFSRLPSQTSDYWDRTVAIVGCEGVGKTEIARKFALEFQETFPNQAWINAETESSALASFLSLARLLEIVPNDRTSADLELVRQIYCRIDQEYNNSVLFIFDNAIRLNSDGPEFGILNYLPTDQLTNHRCPNILITSQTHDWGGRIRTFQVDKFAEFESVEFFQSYFETASCECGNLFKKLHEILQGHPLELNIAALRITLKSMKNSGYHLRKQIKSYIDDHARENNKIKDQKSRPIQNCSLYVEDNLTATNIIAITGNNNAIVTTRVPQKSRFRFNVPTPTPHFKGRSKTMEDVRDYFNQVAAQPKDCWKRTVAIVGLGGMGKTETSYKFAAEYQETFPNVAWINAETERSALAYFLGLAKHLKIASNDRKEADLDLVKDVYQHLDQEDHGRVLFIFDNAVRLHSDEGEFGIMEYLPTDDLPNRRFPFILITTQTNDWERRIETFQVDELSEVESLEFFRSCFAIKSAECDDLFKKLHELLEGFPLVMNLAASQLDYNPKKHSIPQLKQQIKNYIDKLEKENNKILHDKFNRAWPTKYKKTLSNVWQLTFERIQQEENGSDAMELLQIMSFLHVPIQSSLVETILTRSSHCPHPPIKVMEHRLKELIRILERFYTLRILKVHADDEEGYRCELGIHRLVQFVVRHQLDSSKVLERVLFDFAIGDEFDDLDSLNNAALDEALDRIPLSQQALPYVGVLACRGIPAACKFVETRPPETKAAATIWRLYSLERGMKTLDENATQVLRELIELTKSAERLADRHFFGDILMYLLNDQRYCEHERDDGTLVLEYFQLDSYDGMEELVAQLIINIYSVHDFSCKTYNCERVWETRDYKLADLTAKLSKTFIEADGSYSIITAYVISDTWLELFASLKYHEPHEEGLPGFFINFWRNIYDAFHSPSASQARIGALKTSLWNRGLAKELIQVFGFIRHCSDSVSFNDSLCLLKMTDFCIDGTDMRDGRVQEVISSIFQMAASVEKEFIPKDYSHVDSKWNYFTVSLCSLWVKLFSMSEDPPPQKFLDSLSQLEFLVWMERSPKLDEEDDPYFGYEMCYVPDAYLSNHFPQFIQRFSSSDIEPMKTLVNVSRRLLEDHEMFSELDSTNESDTMSD